MDEMGHTDPGLALRVYRQSMRRGEEEKAALRALIEGGHWAIWANGPILSLRRPPSGRPLNEKTPRLAGLSRKRMMGLEPTTFCMASRRSSQLSYIRVGRSF
jgi:hypothetical protein